MHSSTGVRVQRLLCAPESSCAGALAKLLKESGTVSGMFILWAVEDEHAQGPSGMTQEL